jgi:DNA polymerase-3 subunit beta
MMINLRVNELKAAIECAGTKDIRYYLNGVCLDIVNDSEVMIVSTNGSYLFACHADINEMTTDFIGQIIIPIEALKMALKTYDKKAKYIALRSADNNNYYLGSNTVFTPLDGKFPDYQRVIPLVVSGETGQYQPEYTLAISKAMRLYTSGHYEPMLHHNGDSAAVMTSGKAICALMPIRKDNVKYNGFEFPKPKQEKVV